MSSFIELCLAHGKKTEKWVIPQVDRHGKLIDYPEDLACYYKLPYFLSQTGHAEIANRVLNHMQVAFCEGARKLFSDNKKTDNPLVAKFWGYALGWVAVAAHKLGRFDLSFPAYTYLSTFQNQDHGGYATQGPWGMAGNNELDIITTAQLGRLALFFGHKTEAIKAGNFLGWNINSQNNNMYEELYLFVDNLLTHIKNFPKEQEMLYVLKKGAPFQCYFMIGFPCAFLVELYAATQDNTFLDYAKQYGDFALTCHDSIKIFSYSHKVAWAMSLLYRYTHEEKYLHMCKAISEFLMKTQDENGVWLKEEGKNISIDQTIENAIWLNEIAINLSI